MLKALRDAPLAIARLPVELLRAQMAEERLRVGGDRFGLVEDLRKRESLIVHIINLRALSAARLSRQ